MRLQVEHHTRYSFTEPQARVVQLLRLIPHDAAHQTVVHWRIDVDCDARLREGRDGYGNAIRMLYAEGPLEHIGITVTGEVLLTQADGRVSGTPEPLPPALFLRPTLQTAATPELTAFAQGVAGEGATPERLRRLARAIQARWPVARDARAPIRSAAEVFEAPRATPRCMAQLFVAAARSLGVPVRYVSGYSLEGDAERRTAAPHGWAEAWVEDAAGGGGWLAFDPSTGGVPDLDHVRLAVALDAAGAAPIAGTRIGHGGTEALDVDVHLSDVGDEGE